MAEPLESLRFTVTEAFRADPESFAGRNLEEVLTELGSLSSEAPAPTSVLPSSIKAFTVAEVYEEGRDSYSVVFPGALSAQEVVAKLFVEDPDYYAGSPLQISVDELTVYSLEGPPEPEQGDDTGYGLILSESFAQDSYSYRFTDEALWSWIFEPVDFPAGESQIRVSIPGIENDLASVSIGSPENDKAIVLTACGPNFGPHPSLTAVSAKDIRRDLPIERVYEALIY